MTFIDKGGRVLSNVSVQLIFWGKTWTQGVPGGVSPADVSGAVGRLVSGSYLSGLDQYRVSGPFSTLPAVVETTDPPNPFTDGDVQGLITELIASQRVPAPAAVTGDILYCVVMPPKVKSTMSGFLGAHGFFTLAGQAKQVIFA